MGTKIIQLDEITNDEPTVQILRPQDARLYRVKCANDTLDYLKTVKPQDGKTIILVLAMTAGEHYGCNRNGDAWNEEPVQAGSTFMGPETVLPKHYQTFETNGNIFMHHQNKDPSTARGKILKAFYNWKMHRVELLLGLDNKKAEDVVAQIEAGKNPSVSMGCRVAHDVCSICGNKAPSRAQYCDHAKFNLGEFMPDGRRIFVWNPSPNFFDISIVRRPADRVAYMMKKVAEEIPEIVSSYKLGEDWEENSHKAAQLRKLSDIEKVISGEIPLAKTDDGQLHGLKQFDAIAKRATESMPALEDKDIKDMLPFKPAQLLSTLASMGIILTTPEFLKYFLWKVQPGIDIPEDFLQRAVETQQAAFDLLANNPQLLQDVYESGFVNIEPESICPEIAEKFGHLLEKRALLGDYLYRHVVPSVLKSPESMRKGRWDVLNVRDPATGREYQTTRNARDTAADWAVHNQLKDLAAGGLLLGAGYKMLGNKALRFVSPLALGPGAMMAWRGTMGYPSVRAQTGEEVVLPRTRLPWEMPKWMGRGGTEFAEKRSALNIGSAYITALQDHKHTGAKTTKLARLVRTHTDDELTFDSAAAALADAIFS